MNGSILKFDAEKLAKAGNIYNIESKTQTKLLEHDGYDGSTEAKISAKDNRHVKNVDNHRDTHEKSSDVTINATNNTTQNASKQALASEEPSEPSK